MDLNEMLNAELDREGVGDAELRLQAAGMLAGLSRRGSATEEEVRGIVAQASRLHRERATFAAAAGAVAADYTLPPADELERRMEAAGVEERVRNVIRHLHRRAKVGPAWEAWRPGLEIERLVRTYSTKGHPGS